MNARQIEIFHAVMRSGTITGAAAFLGISQPAVSQAIQAAERRIGFPLFRPVRGRLYPTPEAERLLPDADRIIGEMSSFRRLAGEVRTGGAGLVRVAASSACAAMLLPRAAQRFRGTHPNVRLSTHLLPAREVASAVVAGEVDFGLAMSPVQSPGLAARALGNVEMIFMAPEGHALLQKPFVTPADLAGEPLISFGPETFFGQLLDRAFDAAGCRRETVLQVTMTLVAATCVQQGIGVAVVDGLGAAIGLTGIGWRPFRPAIPLPVMLMSEATHPLSRHAAALATAVEEVLAEVGGAAPSPRRRQASDQKR
ncbi:LysR substrate-binding domain-containing protein [Roseomonas sp. 18066]|uniref:LysR substrate-binding domain-containing protein n=1 Tax=Roseomonas sp. 18066 TaxID=2681412 RepID=UPI00135BC8A2|nr:LysR substrate-binding domain-containing protein [Roseomonas sp. 18066]